MFHIICHLESVNESNSEIPQYAYQNVQKAEHWKQNVGEDVEQETHLHCWWEHKWYSHLGG